MMQKVEDLVFRFRALILACLAILTLTMGYFASQIKLDAGFYKTLPIGHEYINTFLQYQDQFAGANRILIVLQAKDGNIFTPEFIETLRQATEDVFYVPGVSRGTVTSLWTANTRYLEVTEEGLRAGDVIPSNFKPNAENMSIVRDNVLKADLVGKLVANDFSAAMIRADLQDIDPDTRETLDYFAVSDRLEKKIRQKYVSDKIDVKIIGFAKLIGDIRDGASDVIGFFGGAFVLTVMALYLYCRSWSLTIVTLTSSLCSLIWQFGLLKILGFGLDPIAILVPFLVFAIGVSHGVQQVNMASAEIAAGKSRIQAARDTFSFLLRPGSVALGTCVAGFATLYIIPVGVIREMAVTASIGVMLKIVSNLLMLPLLISYIAPTSEYAAKVKAAMASREKYWPYIARIAKPHNAAAMIGFCALIGIVGIWRGHYLQIGDVHAGAAELKPDSRYNQDSRFIVKKFNLGLNILTVIVEGHEASNVDYRIMNMMDRFRWSMVNVDGVQDAVNLASVARVLASTWMESDPKFIALPRDPSALAQSTQLVGTATGLWNNSGSVMTLMIFTTDSKAETVQNVVSAIDHFRSLPENQIPGVKIRLASGNIGIVAATNQVVKAAEIPMLLYVYLVVMSLVILTYREWRGALCCVVPLVLSTIIGNWFLTEMQIGLKISTLPVLAIAVGIGVDYGIYEYNRIQRYMRLGKTPYEAYLQALRDVGSATMFTGFTLAVGVTTWVFSPLKFQSDMGLLLGFMFMVNMIGAVTLLPAVIAILEKYFPHKYEPLTEEQIADLKRYAH